MKIEWRSDRDVDVAVLSGELDMGTVSVVKDALMQALGEGRTRLLIDLSDVSFIDSSGLSVFVTALRESRSRGGCVGLLKPQAVVRSVIELTRLDQALPIFEDVTEAVEALTAS